jgi:hypothetical protein
MDTIWYLLWRGLDAEIEDLQKRLTVSVRASIQSCPDTEHAANAAEQMIAAGFAHFRGLKARAR